jgi:hypothetical protein
MDYSIGLSGIGGVFMYSTRWYVAAELVGEFNM